MKNILENRAIANRSAYYQKIKPSTPSGNVTVINYDTSTGLFRCKTEDGSVYLARSISNSSAISKGDIVSLIHTDTGIPIIDAMPR